MKLPAASSMERVVQSNTSRRHSQYSAWRATSLEDQGPPKEAHRQPTLVDTYYAGRSCYFVAPYLEQSTKYRKHTTSVGPGNSPHRSILQVLIREQTHRLYVFFSGPFSNWPHPCLDGSAVPQEPPEQMTVPGIANWSAAMTRRRRLE